MTHLGKYRLIKKLGQGGMGEVYLAETPSWTPCSSEGALEAMAGKSDFVQRFQREARAMAKIITTTPSASMTSMNMRGFHFVAMEYVDGKSMQKWMDELGSCPLAMPCMSFFVASKRFLVAHNQSMIHRDIKPDNIMLTSKGKVKVADFGLAKATDEDMSMTQSGTGLGTLTTWLPSRLVTRSMSIVEPTCMPRHYALLLRHGKLPFAGDSVIQIITSKEKGHFTRLEVESEVPERLI